MLYIFYPIFLKKDVGLERNAVDKIQRKCKSRNKGKFLAIGFFFLRTT